MSRMHVLNEYCKTETKMKWDTYTQEPRRMPVLMARVLRWGLTPAAFSHLQSHPWCHRAHLWSPSWSRWRSLADLIQLFWPRSLFLSAKNSYMSWFRLRSTVRLSLNDNKITGRQITTIQHHLDMITALWRLLVIAWVGRVIRASLRTSRPVL